MTKIDTDLLQLSAEDTMTITEENHFETIMDTIYSEGNIDVPPTLEELGFTTTALKETPIKSDKKSTNITPSKGTGSRTYDYWKSNPTHVKAGSVPGYTTGVQTFSKCGHRGTSLVFSHKGRDFYGATGSSMELDDAKIIIDCGNVNPRSTPFIKSAPQEIMGLNKYRTTPPVIALDWPDFRAPKGIPLQFWRELFDNLPCGKIIVCCIGGHGRTGTCLTALYLATKGGDAYDAAKLVRDRHCKEAIESKEQIEYLYYLEAQARKLKK